MENKDITAEVALSNIVEIQEIISQAPATLLANTASRDKVVQFSRLLLEKEKEHGMSPALDLEMCNFLAKAKTTGTAINDKRKGFTQVMDALKKEFTGCESIIKSEIAAIQSRRNAYATFLENEKQKKLDAQRQQLDKDKAAIDLKSRVAIGLETSFQGLLLERKRQIDSWIDGRTLENINIAEDGLNKVSTEFNPIDLQSLVLTEITDNYLTEEEITAIITEAKRDNARFNSMHTTYTNTLSLHIRNTKALIPSRKAELERIAKAGEEEKKSIEEAAIKREADKKLADQKLADEAIEAAKKEEGAKAASEKIGAELSGANPTIFETPYAPKVKIKNKINVLDHAGYALLFEFWMLNEGAKHDKAKVERTTLGQMKAYCEKHANDSGEMISTPYIEYVNDITAK